MNPSLQFAVLLSIIFLVEIAAAIAGYVFKDKVGGASSSPPTQPLLLSPWFNLINTLSLQFHCCGANNYTDWSSLERFRVNDTVPRSCCRVNTTNCNVHPTADTIYIEGCQKGIEVWMKKNILIVAAVALGIAFFEILGIIFTCCLMKGIRSGYEVM
uniref:CD63 molecule n=1 Tax=Coturnix japonica TaxID=93934 RepID=A0A8C2SX70_COTJA